MPTIEIVSINSTGLELDQVDFEVAIIEENQLKSHRGLFFDLLRKQRGVIVHIGNPNFKDNKDMGFFAGDIIDWSTDPNEYITIPMDNLNDPIYFSRSNQQFIFKICEQYKPNIDKLLSTALDKSPVKKVCFLSDYQFGPENEEIEIIYSIDDFWTRHNNEGLRFNTMYEIYGK